MRILFVEGKSRAKIEAFAAAHAQCWRLLESREQGRFVLEVANPTQEAIDAATHLADLKSWTYQVVGQSD